VRLIQYRTQAFRNDDQIVAQCRRKRRGREREREREGEGGEVIQVNANKKVMKTHREIVISFLRSFSMKRHCDCIENKRIDESPS